jgi:hypothetical protein
MKQRAVDSVEKEIAKEKAEALGLTGKRLEDALHALREFDARQTHESRASADHMRRRAQLVAHAVERVTSMIVQREAQGLRDPGYVFKFYAVPAEVVARLGIRTACDRSLGGVHAF